VSLFAKECPVRQSSLEVLALTWIKKGTQTFTLALQINFLGVLSGYQPDNEIAYVWKSRVISEILERGQRGTLTTKQ
jgi:hypothetical protein